MNSDRELLRHTLATLASRAARALEDAPETFATFDEAGRQPAHILAHMGDLFDWALSMAEASSAGITPSRCRGLRSSAGSSRRCRRLMAISRPANGSMRHLSGFFRGRWPML